MKQFT